MSLMTQPTRGYRVRRLVDWCMRTLLALATLLAVVPLVLIIGYVLVAGGSALNAGFFRQTYLPPLTMDSDFSGVVEQPASSTVLADDPFANLDVGALVGGTATSSDGASAPDVPVATPGVNVVARGGVLHGIVGTLLIAGTAVLIALPIGLLAGIFLAEYDNNVLAIVVRFACDVLSGAPSIVVGVVGYVLLVQRFHSFSGLAGSVALTFLMIPTITRTTEEMLKLIPEGTREAARALGAPTWYSTFTVVVPTALSGIVTGILLAFARGAGETAPLILTVLGNNTLTFNMLGPIAALPLLTYRYTESPFPSENTLAWGAAFVLVMLVLIVNVLVRLVTRNRLRRH